MSTTNIVLIGMPGCGKSSIGAMISKLLHADFYDLDKYIEAREKKSIAELFLSGEDSFRQLETQAVEEIYQKESIVISTGGGIITREKNMVFLRQTGTVFYIDRPVELILNSSDLTTRPLLAADHSRIYTLYEQRQHLYEKYCHFQIRNDDSLEMVAEKIVSVIKTL